MILIADAGSTKIQWALADSAGTHDVWKSQGVNPLLIDEPTLQSAFTEALGRLDASRPLKAIHYYGAGCTPAVAPVVATTLTRVTGCHDVTVSSDMLGAARSLCGHSHGIACILGTGSNSCLFDGNNIVDTTPALGFILGDEGSGASIGRRFVSDLFKRQLSPEAGNRFHEATGLSMADVIDRVYRQPMPNRFLASLAPVVKELTTIPAIHEMVVEEMTRFLQRNVANYPVCHSLPINFTGSIAHHFSPQLTEALRKCDMTLGKIDPTPIEGLIDYHTRQL